MVTDLKLNFVTTDLFERKSCTLDKSIILVYRLEQLDISSLSDNHYNMCCDYMYEHMYLFLVNTSGHTRHISLNKCTCTKLLLYNKKFANGEQQTGHH